MSLQQQIDLKFFSLLNELKHDSLLLNKGVDLLYEVSPSKGLPHDQRKIIERLVELKAIEIVESIYDYLRDVNSTYKHMVNSMGARNIPVIAYRLNLLEPCFGNLLEEYELKTKHLKMTPVRWEIFSDKSFIISYSKGGFFLSPYEIPFYKLQKNLIPSLLWNYAFEQNTLSLSAEDLMQVLKDNAGQKARDSVNKTHRSSFIKALEKFCKQHNLSYSLEGFYQSLLRWEGGTLHLVRPYNTNKVRK